MAKINFFTRDGSNPRGMTAVFSTPYHSQSHGKLHLGGSDNIVNKVDIL